MARQTPPPSAGCNGKCEAATSLRHLGLIYMRSVVVLVLFAFTANVAGHGHADAGISTKWHRGLAPAGVDVDYVVDGVVYEGYFAMPPVKLERLREFFGRSVFDQISTPLPTKARK